MKPLGWLPALILGGALVWRGMMYWIEGF